MSTIAAHLTDLVRRGAEAAGYGDAPVALESCVPTNDPKNGDYQSNHAFRIGKALKTNPRAVAEAVKGALAADPLVASVEVAGPGFLNFRLADAGLAADVTARALDPRLGAALSGAGKTMVIDYSSPNIAKRMHVGHMRSTVIGNAIDRLHRFLGWDVIADNHLGDWGTQFGKLIVAWHGWRDDAAYAEDPIGELQRIYVDFGKRAAEDPTLDDRARAETAKLQAGDPENLALWRQFTEVSLREFQTIYDRMDVRFDAVLGESFYRDRLDAVVKDLLAKGVAEESEGAVVVKFTEEDGKGLSDSPFLIRKKDGASLYGTTDIATAWHRIETWNPSRIVIVTDVRQQLHFRQLFATCRRLGLTVELEHVWFGMLRFADGTVMATRKLDPNQAASGSVNLIDVLDTAVAHARSVVDEKSAELPDAVRADIAEAVGIGAIKYTDLSQNPQTDITFDWQKMLSMEGNTAPYLMYAYARVQSIFRKGEVADFQPGGVVLGEPIERELALAVARTPEIIESAAASYRPNLLCDHLFGLANTFARFYHDCRVLDDDAATRQSRLTLSLAAARALATGLDLLGLRALDRM